MPRGRPPKPDSPYLMKIHKNGKYKYASTQRHYIDENGLKKYRHIHWGTLDEDNTFYPFQNFLYLPQSEREMFVFPEDWNLIKLNELLSPPCAPKTESVIKADENIIDVANSRSYGAVWLLERISDKLGVRDDLMITFKQNQPIVDDIMTVAMYLFITNYNLDRLEEWQNLEKYPSKRKLIPSAITELQKSITEQDRIDFLKCRSKRLGDQAILAVDSTTKTGFDGKLIDLAWGKNKEGLNLPVTLEVVVYSISKHIPIYYKTFAGNAHDSRSIDIILADLKEANFSNYILLMDRAYPSLKNIDRFIKDDIKIVACMKAGTGFSLKQIKALGSFDFVPKGFKYDEDLDLYTAQFDLDRTISLDDGTTKDACDLKLNLYFDPVQRSRALKNLDKSFAQEREELDKAISEKRMYDLETMSEIIDKYNAFDLKWVSQKIPIEDIPDYEEDSHKRGRKKKYITQYMLSGYERSEKNLMAQKITAGFRALVTLGVDFSASEAMYHYGLRCEQEKDNEQWKNWFPCDRERNSSEAAKAGASFIQFVGRIMNCYLRFIWRSSVDLRKDCKSTINIIDIMRRIRCIEYPSASEMRLTPFVGKQLNICKYFEIEVPKGCKPTD